MFITTSRKPSAKTRSFCQSLSRALNSKYVNRGKMSFRDVLIKASQSGFQKIALVSQVKGNPSRIEIYNDKGEILLTLYVSGSLSNLKGKIDSDKLSIRSEIDDLKKSLSDILNIPESHENMNNILWIKKGKGENKATLEFYDKEGKLIDPKIYIRRFE